MCRFTILLRLFFKLCICSFHASAKPQKPRFPEWFNQVSIRKANRTSRYPLFVRTTINWLKKAWGVTVLIDYLHSSPVADHFGLLQRQAAARSFCPSNILVFRNLCVILVCNHSCQCCISWFPSWPQPSFSSSQKPPERSIKFFSSFNISNLSVRKILYSSFKPCTPELAPILPRVLFLSQAKRLSFSLEENSQISYPKTWGPF